MDNLVINKEHPLIKRSQNYTSYRKIISIHSEDRDIKKWPLSNHFEVQLPDSLYNVELIRLVNVALPLSYDLFSTDNQNTKMKFSVESDNYEITISNGFYTPEQMANELMNKMNEAVGGKNFSVHYDEVRHKLWFGNNKKSFILHFDEQLEYEPVCPIQICEGTTGRYPQRIMFDQYSKWGLPDYLGFQKKKYKSIKGTVTFDYLDPKVVFPKGCDNDDDQCYYIEAPCHICLYGDNNAYMELEKYNTIDELDPYPERTNNMYNNDFFARKNSAFAMIPLKSTPTDEHMLFNSSKSSLSNVSYYEPPLERIEKIKVKFRYHDGRLINFGLCNLSFRLEFHMIHNTIEKNMKVHKPITWH